MLYEHRDHGESLWPELDGLRREGLLCDVRIRVGTAVFSAHRVVLAAAIPYF